MTSKKISNILDAKEPEFSHSIQNLERLSGKDGHDIRLVSDTIQNFRTLADHLGLDKNDTTLKELYYALVHQAKQDSKKLAELLKIADDDAPLIAIEKCVKYLEKKIQNRKFWCLKHSTARKEIKANPPKKLMKTLGIRSIDSLIKREPIVPILILSNRVESASWREKTVEQASTITNSDFDDQKIGFHYVRDNRQKQLKKQNIILKQIVYSHNEFSDIVIVPPNKRFDGDVLFYFDAITNHINRIITRSTYYRYKGVHANYFEVIKNVRKNGFKSTSYDNWPFSWSAILHSIKHKENSKIVDTLDPNLRLEDMLTISTPEDIEHLGIWVEDIVYIDENGYVLSTNVSDTIVNAVNKTPYEKAFTETGKNKLHDELFSRYLVSENVLEDIFSVDSTDAMDELF